MALFKSRIMARILENIMIVAIARSKARIKCRCAKIAKAKVVEARSEEVVDCWVGVSLMFFTLLS